MKKQDGRAYIKDLREQYDNDSTKLAQLNESKVLYKSLIYIGKRARRFEKFSTQLQACVDIFTYVGIPTHEQIIVNELWTCIKCQKPPSYVNMLNISSQQKLTIYKLVLQNIATKIPIFFKTSKFKRSIY